MLRQDGEKYIWESVTCVVWLEPGLAQLPNLDRLNGAILGRFWNSRIFYLEFLFSTL